MITAVTGHTLIIIERGGSYKGKTRILDAHHTDHTNDEPIARDTRSEATRPPPPTPIMVEDRDWQDGMAEIKSFSSSDYRPDQPPVNSWQGLQYLESIGYKKSLTRRIPLEDSQVLSFNGLSELTILDLQETAKESHQQRPTPRHIAKNPPNILNVALPGGSIKEQRVRRWRNPADGSPVRR